MRARVALIGLICLTVVTGWTQTNADIAGLEEKAKTIQNEALYYNIGALYLEKGEIGKAVANLKRAYAMNSEDAQIREALTKARETVGVPAYLFDMTPLEKIFLFVFILFPLNVMAIIGIVFFVLGSAGLSAYFIGLWKEFFGKWRYIRQFLIGSAVLLAIGVIYISGSVVRFATVFNPNQGVIDGSGQLMEIPESDGQVIATEKPGMECRINREMGEYYLVSCIDGKEGWIRKEWVIRLWK